MSTTFEQAVAEARERSPEEQEALGLLVSRFLAGAPVTGDDSDTLRGLTEAQAGLGYDEDEARARARSRIEAARGALAE